MSEEGNSRLDVQCTPHIRFANLLCFAFNRCLNTKLPRVLDALHQYFILFIPLAFSFIGTMPNSLLKEKTVSVRIHKAVMMCISFCKCPYSCNKQILSVRTIALTCKHVSLISILLRQKSISVYINKCNRKWNKKLNSKRWKVDISLLHWNVRIEKTTYTCTTFLKINSKTAHIHLYDCNDMEATKHNMREAARMAWVKKVL